MFLDFCRFPADFDSLLNCLVVLVCCQCLEAELKESQYKTHIKKKKNLNTFLNKNEIYLCISISVPKYFTLCVKIQFTFKNEEYVQSLYLAAPT